MPNISMKKKVPISDTGTASVGIKRAAKVAQEQIDHQRNQHERFEQGVQHLLDRSIQEFGNVVADFEVHAGREGFLFDLLELSLTFSITSVALEPGVCLSTIAAEGSPSMSEYRS